MGASLFMRADYFGQMRVSRLGKRGRGSRTDSVRQSILCVKLLSLMDATLLLNHLGRISQQQ